MNVALVFFGGLSLGVVLTLMFTASFFTDHWRDVTVLEAERNNARHQAAYWQERFEKLRDRMEEEWTP